MIGLTLVTVVAVLGAEPEQRDAVGDHRPGRTPTTSSTPRTACRSAPPAATSWRGLPGVKARLPRPLRDRARARQRARRSPGIDPATIAHFYRFDWSTGSDRTLGQLGTDGAIVTKAYAEANHLAVGAKLAVTHARGTASAARRPRHLRPARGRAAAGRHQHRPADVRHARSASAEEQPDVPRRGRRRGRGDQVHGRRPRRRARATPRPATPRPRPRTGQTMLAMLYVLLGFSVVVSLFGMVNTLVLSVFERTREIGMLRTIGMTRRQARRMIRHESVITALIGAALGLGLGLFLAALVHRRECRTSPRSRSRAGAGRLHAGRRARRHRRGRHARPPRLTAQRPGGRCSTSSRHRRSGATNQRTARLADASPRRCPATALALGQALAGRP